MSQGFHRPSTVSEAVTLQASLGDGALFLAGGTEINQKHHPAAPAHLISLAGLELAGIARGDGAVVIGATTTFQQLLDAPQLPEVLRWAAAKLINRNVRNVATVGGQLATAKSCADLIPSLVALEARVLLATSDGSGAVALDQYVAAKPAGLIVAVELPDAAPPRGVAATNFTRSANDLSVLTAAASVGRVGDAVSEPIVAVGGVAPHVVRLQAVEAALAGAPLPARSELEALVADAVTPIDDLRGSAAFKRRVAGALTADVLARAWQATEVAS